MNLTVGVEQLYRESNLVLFLFSDAMSSAVPRRWSQHSRRCHKMSHATAMMFAWSCISRKLQETACHEVILQSCAATSTKPQVLMIDVQVNHPCGHFELDHTFRPFATQCATERISPSQITKLIHNILTFQYNIGLLKYIFLTKL